MGQSFRTRGTAATKPGTYMLNPYMFIPPYDLKWLQPDLEGHENNIINQLKRGRFTRVVASELEAPERSEVLRCSVSKRLRGKDDEASAEAENVLMAMPSILKKSKHPTSSCS